MKKKKSNSNFKYLNLIVICIIVLVVILSILLNMLKNKTFGGQANKTNQTSSNLRERDTDYERPDTISPMFKERLFKEYEGKINEDEILNSLTEFVYYITDNKKEISQMSEEDIQDKYNANKDRFEKMGILTLDYYKYIINIMKSIEKNELELSYTQFDVNSIEKIDSGIILKFNIKYVETNEISLKLIIHIPSGRNTISFVE